MARNVDYPLLIVEDSDEDFEIVQWALHKLEIRASVYRCADGDEALDFLYHQGAYTSLDLAPRPALILLDLGLTMTDGHEVLEKIKADEDLRVIPVIVWTTSSDPRDIDICFRQGANSYILKPMNIDKLLEALELLNQYWFGVVMLPGLDDMEI